MSKFFRPIPKPVTAAELARNLPAPVAVAGDGARVIRGIAGLANAGVDTLTFCDSAQPDAALAAMEASVVIVAAAHAAMPRPHQTLLCVDDVRASFIAAVDLLLPGVARPKEPARGVHPDACVDTSAEVSPLAAIGAGVSIGPETRVCAGAVIYEDCRIGAQCVIGPNAVVGWVGLAYHDCRDGRKLFFPHLGRVCVGDRVDIGANVCICRGMLSDTIIGDQAKLGSLVYVGHGCVVEADAWLSAASAMAGHSTSGARSLLGIGTVVVDNTTIGAGAVLGAGSVVTRDVAPGDRQLGVPARTVPKLKRFGPTPRE